MNPIARLIPLLFVLLAADSPAVRDADVSREVAAAMRSVDGVPARVWIYLRGRSRGAPVEPAARALERRSRRAGTAGPDIHDYPASPDVVAAIRASGARVRHVSRYLNAVSALATPDQIAAIRRMDGVERITRVAHYLRPTPRVPAPATLRPAVTSDDYGASRRQVDQIGVIPLHDDGYHGEGVLVAVLDTGFDRAHEALTGVDVVAEWDFIFDDSVTSDQPQDSLASRLNPQEFHGTAVLSTIAGHAPGTLIGPAWGASYLLAKTERTWEEFDPLTDSLRVEEDDFVRAVEWADSIGADVVTASLGYYTGYDYADMDGNTTVTTIACDIAASRGITVVTSVGNEGSGVLGWPGVLAPADGDSVIAVGAVDSTGAVVGFSSRGPTYDGRIKPDVMAMGRDVLVASYYDSLTYYRLGGTSFAAPLVAGACALLLQVHPTWGPADVLAALRAEASNAASPDNTRGWGVVNAAQSAASGATGVLASVAVALDRVGDDVTVTLTHGGTAAADVDLERRVRSGATLWEAPVTVAGALSLPAGGQRVLVDRGLEAGVYEYRARLSADPSRVSPWRRVEVPFAFSLAQSAPNPFQPTAGGTVSIRFTVGSGPGGLTELSIYDVRGARVRSLFSRLLPPGDYETRWDGRDERGQTVASGVYFYRLSVGSRSLARKLVVVHR